LKKPIERRAKRAYRACQLVRLSDLASDLRLTDYLGVQSRDDSKQVPSGIAARI
jgi:hypothetical protein